jgi:hypothetical protein
MGVGLYRIQQSDGFPLSRPYGRGGAQAEGLGGEGLYTGLKQDPHLPPLRGGPLLSREKRERIFRGSGPG